MARRRWTTRAARRSRSKQSPSRSVAHRDAALGQLQRTLDDTPISCGGQQSEPHVHRALCDDIDRASEAAGTITHGTAPDFQPGAHRPAQRRHPIGIDPVTTHRSWPRCARRRRCCRRQRARDPALGGATTCPKPAPDRCRRARRCGARPRTTRSSRSSASWAAACRYEGRDKLPYRFVDAPAWCRSETVAV